MGTTDSDTRPVIDLAPGTSHRVPPSTARTGYIVTCHKHTSITVYDGYSKSSYDYHRRNSSRNCWKCAEENNARERAKAEKRAREKAAAEERRVRALKQRLEQEERARQEKEARDLEAERQRERDEWQRMRDKLDKERIKIEKSILNESDEKIQEKTDEMKSKKPKNPYTAWKRAKTLDNIKSLGNKALDCSVAGQIIAERVGKIKQDLQHSLKEDYKLVKKEVTRYEGYAKEMKSMTTEFISVFKNVFETGRDEEEFNKDQFDEDRKEYDDPENDEDDKKYYQGQMKENVEALSKAINKMKFKLLLMEQHYIRMREDYDIFIDFIRARKYEYESMKTGISSNLSAFADELDEQKERDVFKGQEHKGDKYKQKLYITEEYDVVNCSKQEKEVQIGTKTIIGNYAMEGAVIGGGVGVLAGGIAGGVAGASIGGPVGCGIGMARGAGVGAAIGAFLGACIGSLIEKKTTIPIIKKETRFKSTKIKNGGYVDQKVKQQLYNGMDHAKALRDIRDAMMPTIQGYLNELQSKQEEATKKKEEFMKMELNIKDMVEKADCFKSNIDGLKDILSSDKGISPSQKKQLDTKWKDTENKVNAFLKSIETMENMNQK